MDIPSFAGSPRAQVTFQDCRGICVAKAGVKRYEQLGLATLEDSQRAGRAAIDVRRFVRGRARRRGDDADRSR